MSLRQKIRDCGGCARRREALRRAVHPLVDALYRAGKPTHAKQPTNQKRNPR